MPVPINGKMMKEVRSHRLLSQQQLSENSMVSIATIKRIESSDGSYKCNIVSASRLASTLGVTVEDLSEDKFTKVIDIGGDLELHLDGHVDPAEFLKNSEEIAVLIRLRNRIIKKPS